MRTSLDTVYALVHDKCYRATAHQARPSLYSHGDGVHKYGLQPSNSDNVLVSGFGHLEPRFQATSEPDTQQSSCIWPSGRHGLPDYPRATSWSASCKLHGTWSLQPIADDDTSVAERYTALVPSLYLPSFSTISAMPFSDVHDVSNTISLMPDGDTLDHPFVPPWLLRIYTKNGGKSTWRN